MRIINVFLRKNTENNNDEKDWGQKIKNNSMLIIWIFMLFIILSINYKFNIYKDNSFEWVLQKLELPYLHIDPIIYPIIYYICIIISSGALFYAYNLTKNRKERGEQIGIIFGFLRRFVLLICLSIIIPNPNSFLWHNSIMIAILGYEHKDISNYLIPRDIIQLTNIIYPTIFVILFIAIIYHYYKTNSFVLIKTYTMLFLMYFISFDKLSFIIREFSLESLHAISEYVNFMILYFWAIYIYILAIISYARDGIFGPAEEPHEYNLSKIITRSRFPLLISFASVSVIYSVLYLIELTNQFPDDPPTVLSNSIIISFTIITIFIWLFIIIGYTITNGKTVDYIYKYATMNRTGRLKLIIFIGIAKLITMNYLIYFHVYPIFIYLLVNIVLDIAIGTPIYEFVFQIFNSPDEIDKYIRNKIIFEMYHDRVLLIFGAGSVGRSVAQAFIERIIYGQNQMEAFIIGASDIKDNNTNVLFSRVRRDFGIIEPRIYFVSGIVIAEPDTSLVSHIDTDPFFGNYGLAHIDIEIKKGDKMERVKFLIPAIIEGIKNKEVNLELLKTSKLVAQTSRISKVSQRVVRYTEEILQDYPKKSMFLVLNVTSGPTYLYVYSKNNFDKNNSLITYFPIYATKEMAILDAYYIYLLHIMGNKGDSFPIRLIILGGYMKEITYMIETLLTLNQNFIIDTKKNLQNYVFLDIVVVTTDSSERIYHRDELATYIGNSVLQDKKTKKSSLPDYFNKYSNFQIVKLINFDNQFIDNNIKGFIFPVITKEVDYPWLEEVIKNNNNKHLIIWINDLDPNINMTYMVKVFHTLAYNNYNNIKPSVLISARSETEGEFAYKFLNEAYNQFISGGFVLYPSNITGRKIASILSHGRQKLESNKNKKSNSDNSQNQINQGCNNNIEYHSCRRHCPISLFYTLKKYKQNNTEISNFAKQIYCKLDDSAIKLFSTFKSKIYLECVKNDNEFYSKYKKGATKNA